MKIIKKKNKGQIFREKKEKIRKWRERRRFKSD
jgi:hypothetical protein